ncbi:MAG: M15 family metallopeptidase, partial [Oscillospiraceae bacterium]|nr:M15 family metallopeptidase [Oscillospiraceae bacterium]
FILILTVFLFALTVFISYNVFLKRGRGSPPPPPFETGESSESRTNAESRAETSGYFTETVSEDGTPSDLYGLATGSGAQTGSDAGTSAASGNTTAAPPETSNNVGGGYAEPDELPVPAVITINETSWELALVNINYKLPDGFVPETAPSIKGSDILLDKRAAVYYQSMYDAAKNEGVILTPYSGYRSISRQKTNFENKTQHYKNQGYGQAKAQVLAAQVIMPPGCSEHNMGLAMDICNTETSFENSGQFKWLNENAADYGFILRYAKDKQKITGVIYEPWHWRYVGVENAKAIKASGLCLEEYLSLS